MRPTDLADKLKTERTRALRMEVDNALGRGRHANDGERKQIQSQRNSDPFFRLETLGLLFTVYNFKDKYVWVGGELNKSREEDCILIFPDSNFHTLTALAQAALDLVKIEYLNSIKTK